MLLLTVTALQDGELLSVSSQATITPPLDRALAAAVAGGSQRSAAISERLVLDGSPSRDPSRKGDLAFSWVCVEASGAAAAASDDPCASVLRAIDTDVAALVLPKFSLIPSSAYTFTLTVSSTWPEDTRKEATATVVVGGAGVESDGRRLAVAAAGRLAAVDDRRRPAARRGGGHRRRAPPARWAYRWELRAVDDGEAFELPAGAGGKRALVLPAGTLQAGRYEARLSAAAALPGGGARRRRGRMGLRVGGLRAQRAAGGGRALAAEPASGEAVTTTFTLTADGFDDAAADLPLSYRFFYYEEGEGARRTPLAPPSEASFLDGVLLPAGNVTVGCVVADAHGATCECEPIVVAVAPTSASVDSLRGRLGES